MKIQVKTLNQKSLLVEIDDTKTVLELKLELARYPDVGVNPEQQKLIYAGKILENNDALSIYNIDEKKFLVVMVVKQPQSTAASATTPDQRSVGASSTKTSETPTTTTETNIEANRTPATATATAAAAANAVAAPEAAALQSQPQATSAQLSEQDEMVANIVSMGYPESEVRSALEASFNNPERAVEYLIEGIPASPVLPDGAQVAGEGEDMELSPFELLRSDPVFRNLRSLIQQNPELIDEAVQRIGEANPALLNVINDHQQEFLNMLFEQTDDEDGEDST